MACSRRGLDNRQGRSLCLAAVRRFTDYRQSIGRGSPPMVLSCHRVTRRAGPAGGDIGIGI